MQFRQIVKRLNVRLSGGVCYEENLIIFPIHDEKGEGR